MLARNFCLGTLDQTNVAFYLVFAYNGSQTQKYSLVERPDCWRRRQAVRR
jgi:hypothetical protein